MTDPLSQLFYGIAGNLATDLLKAGYRKLRGMAEGSPQQRTLQEAWTLALQYALVKRLPGFQQEEKDHLESLLREYIQSQDVADNLLDLALLDGQPDLELLQERFAACGLDGESLFIYYQLNFNTLLDAILEGLKVSLRGLAGNEKSPIYNLVSLGKLDAIQMGLQSMERKIDQLREAIRNLEQGLIDPKDLQFLRKALEEGNLSFHREQITVGDSVQGSIVIGDRNIIVTLSPEALRRLDEKRTVITIREPPKDFTGRKGEQDKLLAAFDQSTHGAIITGVTGGAGIGKTALALVLAKRLAARYPEYRLYIDLRGAAKPPEKALTPVEAMQNLLRQVDPELKIPDTLEEIAGLYQSTFRQKAALILLDNALDAAQVRKLVPPAPSAAIVTSRRNFILEGFCPLHLELLDPGDARDLLREISNQLKEVADDELNQLVRLCGRLPLALRVAASLFQQRPRWSFQKLVDDLADERKRLDRLSKKDDPELDARTLIGYSYNNLEPEMMQRFRFLGVFSAPFDLSALGAIWEGSDESPLIQLMRSIPLKFSDLPGMGDESEKLSEQAESDLDLLIELNLLEYSKEKDDFSQHDLTRLFARERLLESEAESLLVLDRYANWCLGKARKAEEIFVAGGQDLLTGLLQFDALWPHFSEAWVRLSGEQTGWPVLESVDRWLSNFPGYTAHLLDLRLTPGQRIPYLQAAYEAAKRLGDQRDQGNHLGNLGSAYQNMGQVEAAIGYYEQALGIAREIGDRRMEGSALGNLGTAYRSVGQVEAAIGYHEQALGIAREIGDRRGEGTWLGNLGNAYYSLGQVEAAIGYYEQALGIAREIGDRRGEGTRLGNLGSAYWELNDHGKAIEFYDKQLEIDPDNAMAHRNRANSLIRLDRLNEAELDCRASERLAPNHPYTHARWGQLHHGRAEFSAALAYYQQAAALHQDKTEFNFDLALSLLCLSKPDEALEAVRERLIVHPKPRDLDSMILEFEKLQNEKPNLVGLDEAIRLLREARSTSQAPGNYDNG